MKYYSAKTVTQLLGVTAQTLRNWDKEGKLKPSYVKSNGYRYYSEDAILSYTQERKTKKNLNVIGYARVSSKKQSDDLASNLVPSMFSSSKSILCSFFYLFASKKRM